MGGRIAQTLAADRPDLVDRLVLACTSPGGEHATERSTDVRRQLGDPDPERRHGALRELFYTPAWTGDSHLLGDPTMSAAEARAHLRASDGHDAWDQLPRVSAPTLVLHGTEDLMVPAANAFAIAGRIPGARLHLVPGGRHGFFEEYASQVTPLVAHFLGEATVRT